MVKLSPGPDLIWITSLVLLTLASGLAAYPWRHLYFYPNWSSAPRLAWEAFLLHLHLVLAAWLALQSHLPAEERAVLFGFVLGFGLRISLFRHSIGRLWQVRALQSLVFAALAGLFVLLTAAAVTPLEQCAALHIGVLGLSWTTEFTIVLIPQRRVRTVARSIGLLLLLPAYILITALIVRGRPEGSLLGTVSGDKSDWEAPTIVARSGASWAAPESTVPAFVAAREIDPDYVKVAVQRTRDDVLIAFNRPDLRQTTNVEARFPERARSPVSAFDWSELRELDNGSWFNELHPARARAAFRTLKILRLADVLHVLQSGAGRVPGVYVEAKSPVLFPGLEKALVEELKRLGWLAAPLDGARSGRRVVLQSTHPESIERFKTLAPRVPRALVLGAYAGAKGFEEAITIGRRLEAQLTVSGLEGRPELTRAAHQAGLRVLHFTVNRPWEMYLLWEFGSDGFVTDRPDVGLRFMGRASLTSEAVLDAWEAAR